MYSEIFILSPIMIFVFLMSRTSPEIALSKLRILKVLAENRVANLSVKRRRKYIVT